MIVDAVSRKYLKNTFKFEMLTKKTKEARQSWINKVLVLGLNSNRYNLNLLQEDFVRTLADLKDDEITKKEEKKCVIDERKSLCNNGFI